MNDTRESGKQTRMTDPRQATMRTFTGAVLLVLLAGVLLPVAGSVASTTLASAWRWDHVPFHSAVEVAGALFALALAVILLASRTPGSNPHHLWMAAALIGMGILDIAHAAVAPGETFVWFHGTATCVGGILFALVWLPARIADSPRSRLVLPLTGAAALAVCVFSLGFPGMIPPMVDEGAFTTTARALNVLGGLGFLAAAGWFLKRYRVARRWDDYLFTYLCGLLGTAGVLFELSSLWDAAWWWWHLLRLAAYSLAIAYSAIAYQRESAERRQSEANLQAIFDASQVGMLLVDEDTQVTRVNDVVARLVGKDASEILSRKPGDGLCCIHAGETPGGCGHAAACRDCPVRAAAERALADGQTIKNAELSMRLVIGGEERQLCFAVSATPLELDGKRHALLALMDISEREQAEQDLLRSETKFRTLYDSTSDAVMLLDEKGFFDCNDATVRIFGCKDKAEFCTQHPADLSPAKQPCGTDSMTLANQRIATAMEKGSNRFEWVHKRLDTGESFPAEVLLNAMELDGRQVLQAVVRDITARKRAEDSLRESKDRFERAATAVSDLIYEWDVTTDRLEWLGDVNAALGYPQDTIPPTIEGWLALIHPEDRQKIADAVEHHRESPEPINVTYRIRHKDGEWRHWEDRGSAVLDDAGQPVRVIGACSDITERKRAEQQLDEHIAALESANKALEELSEADKVASLALAEKLEEVEAFNRLAVGRELRMVELKEEVNGLLAEQGKSPKYEIAETEVTL